MRIWSSLSDSPSFFMVVLGTPFWIDAGDVGVGAAVDPAVVGQVGALAAAAGAAVAAAAEAAEQRLAFLQRRRVGGRRVARRRTPGDFRDGREPAQPDDRPSRPSDRRPADAESTTASSRQSDRPGAPSPAAPDAHGHRPVPRLRESADGLVRGCASGRRPGPAGPTGRARPRPGRSRPSGRGRTSAPPRRSGNASAAASAAGRNASLPGPALVGQPGAPRRDHVARPLPARRDGLQDRLGAGVRPAPRALRARAPRPPPPRPAASASAGGPSPGPDDRAGTRDVIRPGIEDPLREPVVGHDAQDHVAELLGRQLRGVGVVRGVGPVDPERDAELLGEQAGDLVVEPGRARGGPSRTAGCSGRGPPPARRPSGPCASPVYGCLDVWTRCIWGSRPRSATACRIASRRRPGRRGPARGRGGNRARGSGPGPGRRCRPRSGRRGPRRRAASARRRPGTWRSRCSSGPRARSRRRAPAAEVGRGVQGPADVGPEVGEVDLAVVEGLERGELVAVAAAEVAPLAEPVIGDRAGLGAEALRRRRP